MKIAIIGGGWTGCHLASCLLNQGMNVTLFERAPTLFAAASGNNQSRLHSGFHCPRSAECIAELVSSANEFRAVYPQFVAPIENNLYAIAATESLIDFTTFRANLRKWGVGYTIVDAARHGLVGVEGVLRCGEMTINNAAAALWFKTRLQGILSLNSEIDCQQISSSGVLNGQRYDYIINCTANLAASLVSEDYYYQVCAIFRYQSANFGDRAITVMDGDFASLYPRWIDGRIEYLLSGVMEGVLSSHTRADAALAASQKIDLETLANARKAMEKNIERFYPEFSQMFQPSGTLMSIKTRRGDSRSVVPEAQVVVDGRLIHAICFKLSQVCRIGHAVHEFLGLAESYSAQFADCSESV